MSVSPGQRFGSYEVAASIGAGGMGEVFRARDTNLKRDVALKLLPKAFLEDQDRLARFQREAEMLAALNHPNIAQVYGLEKADGQTAIVMELIEGPTLAERIQQGPIPPDEAMAIALQVIAALEAAHDKGIVHRDLKPANVKVREDGTVKVLDFGISKAIDPQMISGGTPIATTPAMTQTGIILGTAAYMSPEQARGRFVDERTDIWAFGCLFFEMLTGQPAFGGEDMMAVLARIIDRPTDLSSMPKALSPTVRHTIRLCLEKDPRKRIADIRDVRLALEGRFESPLEGTAVGWAPRTVPLWRRALIPSVTLVVGGLIVALAALWLRPTPAPTLLTRFAHVLEANQNFRSPGRDMLALSRDGRMLAYNTTAGLFLRALGDIDARPVPGTESQITNPFFSPDGEWIAYWNNADQQLKKLRLNGGSPVPLTASPNIQGAYWAADGSIVYGHPDGIMRVPETAGTPELLIVAPEGTGFWDPQVLPDGSILYVAWTANAGNGMVVIESPGGGRTELFPGERAVYLETGHLVTTDGATLGTLYVRSFDLATRTFGGPVPIEEGVFLNQGKHQFAISPGGVLAFITGAPVEATEVRLAIVARAGEVDLIAAEPRQFRGPRVSPSGNELAVEVIGDNGRSSIWVYDLTGARAPRLLLGAGSNVRPLWTPDGERLTYASNRDGNWGIYWQAADGSGVAARLTMAEDGVEHWPDSWSGDGRTLAFTRIEGSLDSIGIQGISTVTLDEAGNPGEPVVFIRDQAGGAALSPNGQWIAYRSTDPAVGVVNQIHVQPFPPTGAVHPVTNAGGSYPIFAREGDELVYRRPSTGTNLPLTLGRLDVTSGESFAWGNETEIPIAGGVAFFGYRDFDLLPDGERLVALVSGEQAATLADTRATIEIVSGWFNLVQERAPPPGR